MIHPGGTIPLLSENRNRCPILPRCNMNGCRGQEENPKRCLGLNALYSRMYVLQKRRKQELLFLIILIDFFGMRP